MSIQNFPFGIDVSRYNGEVNWDIAQEHGVVFAGMRASISWGYRDPWIIRNMSECLQRGIEIMPYHVLYPKENIYKQFDNFCGSIRDMPDAAFVPVIDAELNHDAPKNQITDSLLMLHNLLLERYEQVIIYSRASWINDYTENGSWRNSVNWWLASYNPIQTLERTLPPTLPVGVSKWLIHQTSGKYPAWPGLNNGSDAIKSVDTDRWNGTQDDMRKFFSPYTSELTWEQSIDAWARTMGYEGIRPQ